MSDVGVGDVFLGTEGNIRVDIPGAPIWLVHGTWNRDDGGIKDHWDDAGFRTYIRGLFGYDYHRPEWDGINNMPSRIQGAQAIAKQIKCWSRVNPDLPLILIGFSHGGNVNKEIVNILARETPPVFVNTLINIATPIRPEFTLSVRVGQHINVFNRLDAIQVAGSQHTITVGVPDAESGMDLPRQRRALSRDPRRYEGALNIEVPRPFIFVFHFLDNHKFMHANPAVWDGHIREHIILPPPN